MSYIKLKILVGFLLIYLIDQICCETNNLEDKYEIGREILLSISIHHENITNIFAKIDKEYDDLSNIFNDLNNKSINDFIELSKQQIVVEVNNLAKTLNKFSKDEQSKYENFIRTNTDTHKEKMPLFNSCLKQYNSLKKSLRCIDQQKNSNNKTDNKFYENIKNLIDIYNTILISKIKDIENKFITTTSKILSDAKNNNVVFIKKNMPPTSSTKKNNSNVKHLASEIVVNDTLKNLYVNHTRWLNSVDIKNWISIQSIGLNFTLKHISIMNDIDDNDKKKVRCCFNYSRLQLAKLKSLAVNESDKCIENELFHLNNLILLNLKDNETRKLFNDCFENNILPESIVECMGWINPFNSSPLLKIIYNENVAKLNSNKRFSFARIYQCFYDSRDYFDQRLRYLNNQFDICIVNEGFFIGCIDPDNAYNFKPTSLLLSPETSQSVSHIVYS